MYIYIRIYIIYIYLPGVPWDAMCLSCKFWGILLVDYSVTKRLWSTKIRFLSALQCSAVLCTALQFQGCNLALPQWLLFSFEANCISVRILRRYHAVAISRCMERLVVSWVFSGYSNGRGKMHYEHGMGWPSELIWACRKVFAHSLVPTRTDLYRLVPTYTAFTHFTRFDMLWCWFKVPPMALTPSWNQPWPLEFGTRKW